MTSLCGRSETTAFKRSTLILYGSLAHLGTWKFHLFRPRYDCRDFDHNRTRIAVAAFEVHSELILNKLMPSAWRRAPGRPARRAAGSSPPVTTPTHESQPPAAGHVTVAPAEPLKADGGSQRRFAIGATNSMRRSLADLRLSFKFGAAACHELLQAELLQVRCRGQSRLSPSLALDVCQWHLLTESPADQPKALPGPSGPACQPECPGPGAPRRPRRRRTPPA
jgi:hypothetical protein